MMWWRWVWGNKYSERKLQLLHWEICSLANNLHLIDKDDDDDVDDSDGDDDDSDGDGNDND